MNMWDRRLAKPRSNCELEEGTLLSQHSRRVAEIRNLILCVSIGEKKASMNPCEMEHAVKAESCAHLAF